MNRPQVRAVMPRGGMSSCRPSLGAYRRLLRTQHQQRSGGDLQVETMTLRQGSGLQHLALLHLPPWRWTLDL